VSLYEIADSGLIPHSPAAFADLGLYERADLQQIIRDEIGVLGDDLRVIAEEFGNWEDARRRIDLLAVDKAGCLVVIELKRDDGARMDLQAVRYGAMVSSMDFNDVVIAHEAHLAKTPPQATLDARVELTSFIARRSLSHGESSSLSSDGPMLSTLVRSSSARAASRRFRTHGKAATFHSP
jgi:hypothetical protein